MHFMNLLFRSNESSEKRRSPIRSSLVFYIGKHLCKAIATVHWLAPLVQHGYNHTGWPDLGAKYPNFQMLVSPGVNGLQCFCFGNNARGYMRRSGFARRLPDRPVQIIDMYI